jgi:hypothetical protein
MNKVSNQTGAQDVRTAIRHGRHPRHQDRLRRLRRLHRLSHGIGDGQDARCRERHGQTFGHPEEPEGTRRPGDYARRGHHDHSGRGRSRRAVQELHKALADVARTGDGQLRREAAQIVTEATTRLNGLMATDRGHLA